MDLGSAKIGIIGLGYVGLPLAVEFGKKRPVVGFDISSSRIAQLREGLDTTREVSSEEIAQARYLKFSDNCDDLNGCGIFIVAVPTPIDCAKRPDLEILEEASRTIGQMLRRGGVVIYESTVFPGCTRNVCVPILERVSGLKFNEDFFVGYSPERINPGDKFHRLTMIVKVTSGSTPEAAKAVDKLYSDIIPAGTHAAASIEVAEAAKVIENTQRDLNIALMNELAIIFQRLAIDTHEVLAAASTKWNFLPFKPGLVGGHCIGVDPYYLTHRAREVGYHPEVILAGRRINDEIGSYVADQVAHMMMRRRIPVVGSHVLILGLAFKENCPDLRNTKVIDLIAGLRDMSACVDICDPWVSPEEALEAYGMEVVASPVEGIAYDAMILAVSHNEFIEMGAARIRKFGKPGAVFYDVKGVFLKSESDGRL